MVVSGSPTATWRFPRSNEAEASLHADARRLRQTAAQEITRAGRANPPRPGVETARHGTSGTCVEKCALSPSISVFFRRVIASSFVTSSFRFDDLTLQRSSKMPRRPLKRKMVFK